MKLGVSAPKGLQYSHARELARKVQECRDNQHGSKAYNNLGNAFLKAGKFDEAIVELRKAIELDPKDSSGYLDLGTALSQKGEFGEAIHAFESFAQLQPRDALHHNNLAWLLATCPEEQFRDLARAVLLAEKAVELIPKNGTFWNPLGVARRRAGDYTGAVEALEKSDELEHDGYYSSFNGFCLAMALQQLGEKEKARERYDKAVEWMDKNKPDHEELIRFRAEAEKLLGVNTPAVAPKAALQKSEIGNQKQVKQTDP